MAFSPVAVSVPVTDVSSLVESSYSAECAPESVIPVTSTVSVPALSEVQLKLPSTVRFGRSLASSPYSAVEPSALVSSSVPVAVLYASTF